MRNLHALPAIQRAVLALSFLAACQVPNWADSTQTAMAQQESTDGQQGRGESASSKLLPSEIKTGFRGHFACQTFTGVNRELAVAVSEGQVDRVAALLQEGADINARSDASHTRGMTLLQTAVWHRWGSDCVQILLDAGADPEALDDVGNTPLIYACQSGPEPDAKVVELLVASGAQVDVRGAKGMTPLMHAVMQDRSLKVVELLRDAGADVNGQDTGGWTPLMHCTRNRGDRGQVAHVLIAAGANVNATHRHGGTALLNAAYLGRSQVVDVLLAAGANVNAKDEAGWTPLNAAALNGHDTVVRSLLKAGAQVMSPDRMGRSALKLAEMGGHTDIASLLVGAGATK